MLQPALVALAFGAFAAGVELLAIALFITILCQTARQSVEPPSKYEKFIFGSVF